METVVVLVLNCFQNCCSWRKEWKRKDDILQSFFFFHNGDWDC